MLPLGRAVNSICQPLTAVKLKVFVPAFQLQSLATLNEAYFLVANTEFAPPTTPNSMASVRTSLVIFLIINQISYKIKD
jgi:hypothetical protein